MAAISARDASRGFAALLDHVESDGEEYTVIRDGKPVARIVPATARTIDGFLARRANSPKLDDDFAADATAATPLLTTDQSDPWPA